LSASVSLSSGFPSAGFLHNTPPGLLCGWCLQDSAKWHFQRLLLLSLHKTSSRSDPALFVRRWCKWCRLSTRHCHHFLSRQLARHITPLFQFCSFQTNFPSAPTIFQPLPSRFLLHSAWLLMLISAMIFLRKGRTLHRSITSLHLYFPIQALLTFQLIFVSGVLYPIRNTSLQTLAQLRIRSEEHTSELQSREK